MGKRKRKRYRPKFKFQVVLEVLALFGSQISHLITPHGDRKPRGRSASDTVVYPPVFSLPLMGIVNRQTTRIPNLGRDLITPHGDRKLGGHPSRSNLRGPHYPSWGS